MNARPNIILICTDQWRGDCLGSEGHPVVETPYLDGLAREGCRFRNAYTTSPSCIASRAALFTGLSQESHGRVGYFAGVPWRYPVTLAGEFTQAGYQTQAIGKMHVHPQRSQQGFQNVILHDGHLPGSTNGDNIDEVDDYLPWLRRELGRDADYFDHGIDCNSATMARPWDKPEYTHPSNWATSEAIDFLRRRDTDKPFFLYLSYHRPHPPFDPPQWAMDLYLDKDMPDPPVGNWVNHFEHLDQTGLPEPWFARLDKTTLKRARAGYYGLITQIDHQLNRLFHHLKERKLYDNTWICFVSDHGELLGDHHLYRKSAPYEGSSRVPLILRGPDGALEPGHVSHELVELRDIMPSLLACAGIPIPDTVEGKSFLPNAKGETQPLRDFLHGEHLNLRGPIHWLHTPTEKYIWHARDGVEQYFNLEDDPKELNDLCISGGADDRVAYWREQMVTVLTDRPEGFVENGRLVPGRPGMPTLPSCP
ncbi:MAG: arylsulfatase [Puniceicoccaceae bacterium]